MHESPEYECKWRGHRNLNRRSSFFFLFYLIFIVHLLFLKLLDLEAVEQQMKYDEIEK